MKHATLTFDREQLLYDVRNYSYIEADTQKSDDEHDKHQTFDVGEEGNVDRVTRIFGLCHAECVEVLYPLTKHEVHVSDEPTPWNDKLDEREQYRIDLILEDNWSQTTVNLLEHQIHEYMVCKAVADWMSFTKPEKEEVWERKAEKALSEIRKSKSNRIRHKRRRISPF